MVPAEQPWARGQHHEFKGQRSAQDPERGATSEAFPGSLAERPAWPAAADRPTRGGRSARRITSMQERDGVPRLGKHGVDAAEDLAGDFQAAAGRFAGAEGSFSAAVRSPLSPPASGQSISTVTSAPFSPLAPAQFPARSVRPTKATSCLCMDWNISTLFLGLAHHGDDKPEQQGQEQGRHGRAGEQAQQHADRKKIAEKQTTRGTATSRPGSHPRRGDRSPAGWPR